MNWKLGEQALDYPAKIAVDSVKVYENNNMVNLISSTDSSFDYTGNNTSWELNLVISKGNYLPFSSRTPLIEELNNANTQLSSVINLSTTKIIISIPWLNYEKYIGNPNMITQLKLQLHDYVDKIENYYNDSSFTEKIEIEVLYYLKEFILDSDEVIFINDVFGDLKNYISSKGWKLYMSPYQMLYSCDTSASLDDELFNLFDVLWQQPTAFYDSSVFGSVDRDVLKNANNIMASNNLNVNIESTVLNEGEIYSRVNDYFDYGDKFGYINYSKVYYDNAGAHYKNAYSSFPEERVDYDNLYKFIKKSRGRCFN